VRGIAAAARPVVNGEGPARDAEPYIPPRLPCPIPEGLASCALSEDDEPSEDRRSENARKSPCPRGPPKKARNIHSSGNASRMSQSIGAVSFRNPNGQGRTVLKKTSVCLGVGATLLATAAFVAQAPQPPARGPRPLSPGAAPSSPQPPSGTATTGQAPQRPAGSPQGEASPPPAEGPPLPPSKAAHFRVEQGGVKAAAR
jgi:hypothetical protein